MNIFIYDLMYFVAITSKKYHIILGPISQNRNLPLLELKTYSSRFVVSLSTALHCMANLHKPGHPPDAAELRETKMNIRVGGGVLQNTTVLYPIYYADDDIFRTMWDIFKSQKFI